MDIQHSKTFYCISGSIASPVRSVKHGRVFNINFSLCLPGWLAGWLAPDLPSLSLAQIQTTPGSNLQSLHPPSGLVWSGLSPGKQRSPAHISHTTHVHCTVGHLVAEIQISYEDNVMLYFLILALSQLFGKLVIFPIDGV